MYTSRARNIRYGNTKVNSCCNNCSQGQPCAGVNGEVSDVLDRFASGQPLALIELSFSTKTIIMSGIAAVIAGKMINAK